MRSAHGAEAQHRPLATHTLPRRRNATQPRRRHTHEEDTHTAEQREMCSGSGRTHLGAASAAASGRTPSRRTTPSSPGHTTQHDKRGTFVTRDDDDVPRTGTAVAALQRRQPSSQGIAMPRASHDASALCSTPAQSRRKCIRFANKVHEQPASAVDAGNGGGQTTSSAALADGNRARGTADATTAASSTNLPRVVQRHLVRRVDAALLAPRRHVAVAGL
jgi:hypothetical protein